MSRPAQAASLQLGEVSPRALGGGLCPPPLDPKFFPHRNLIVSDEFPNGSKVPA